MHLCVAYPTLKPEDYSAIKAFRELHDQRYVDVIDAHWTMVFPSSCDGFTYEQLDTHIQQVAQSSKSIEFEVDYALVYDDAESDDHYIFLVPDLGFSQISRLHDKLYSGPLRSKLRLDIPFIPHIGIATSKDPEALYELAQQWNAHQPKIKGKIDTLTLSEYDGQKVTDLKSYKLL